MSVSFDRFGRITLGLSAALFVVNAVWAQRVGTAPPPSLEKYIRNQVTQLPAGTVLKKSLTFRRGRPLLQRPIPPFKRPTEALPANSPAVQRYREELSEFIEASQQLQDIQRSHALVAGLQKRLQFFSGEQQLDRLTYMGLQAARWNGDILWAPAAKETDVNLRYADEVRSVFGPIPPFDVTQLGVVQRPDGWTSETASLFVEVDGNRVELKPNTNKPGNPLEFEHRDASGVIVKWSQDVKLCDKPSLAGGVTPCGTASRIARFSKGNVEWLALARKTRGASPLTAEPYWSHANPDYALLGYIGFNRVTGEVAFFDGDPAQTFSWDAPTVAPGGQGYSDEVGRSAASRIYDPTFTVNCAACHDNKEPRIVTPYIKQARVGYRKPELASAFSAGTLLPDLMRSERSPYRVVGSAYNLVHQGTIDGGRMVRDPSGRCTACHGLTNLNTARFASDAVARLGSLPDDTGPENAFRTAWALRTGDGKIHPWMLPPPDGNSLARDPVAPGLSDSDWDRLRALMLSPEPNALRVFTKAPAPESERDEATRLADPFKPENFALVVQPNRDGAGQKMPHEFTLSWTYLNGLGDVPARDDVRFDVAIREAAIPTGGTPPLPGEYPTLDDLKGSSASELGGGAFSDGRNLIFRNLSFVGHSKWTDPPPTTVPRQYRLSVPADRRKRYLIRVSPKRFPFDQSGELYSDKDHLFFVDTP